MKKLVIGIIFISTLVFLAAWLWTLQPTSAPKNVLSEKNSAVQTPQQTSNFNPPDFSVLKSAAITLDGKADPNQIVAIYTAGFGKIIKADPKGNFQQILTLQRGLNLVKVSKFSPDLKNSDDTTLTYDVNGNTPTTVVFAGTVKTIFDTLITVTTASGEKSIRAGKSTTIDVPKETSTEESTPSTALELIRIGDYTIALGSYPAEKNQTDTVVAQSISIIRDNKPQIDAQAIAVKTLTDEAKNAITVKNSKGETIELTLDKNTTVVVAGHDSAIDSIVKDKEAIIIYHQLDTDNVLDTIYII